MIRTHVMICGGTGCTSSDSPKIAEAMENEIVKLGLQDEVKVVRTGCFGLCEMGPVMIVYPDGTFYSRVKVSDVPEIASEHLLKGRIVERLVHRDTEGGEKVEVPTLKDIEFYKPQLRVALRNCGVINPEDIEEYIAMDGYSALGKVLTEMTREQVIDVVTKSGLRGRGGAGFPTGLKWKFAAVNQTPNKYVVCNADEGDPGAFMDRSVLEGDPHAILEAMCIAGYAINANQGYIYVRAEYPIAVHRLQIAIRQAREYGLLGKDIFGTGFDFDIDVRLGAGAFVCGEETALLTSIEGNRGEPKTKPPFPANKGLFGQPTIINNVETLANIPQIILKGAEWFASMGTEGSKGTKVFALGGKINNTGLVEVPLGTTLRQIIYDIGGGIPDGKAFKAVQTGGPSGGCIPAKFLDLPIDYENLKFRRYDRHGRDHLHGGRGPVLSGLHRGRELRQVRPLPDRHPPLAGDAGQDHQRQRHLGGSGQDGGAVPLHPGQRPVRPGSDGPQPRALHAEVLPRRVRGPRGRKALPRRRVQEAPAL